MPSRRMIIRHGLTSLVFSLLFFLLVRPEVTLFSRIGFVAWYPAIGVAMALMLGVSPRYAILTCLIGPIVNRDVYAEPFLSFSTVDALGTAVCYGTAAYVLRRPLQLDLGLRRRGDVVRYVLVCTLAAAAAAIIGVACLIADHNIRWGDFRSSAVGWFLGDTIGLAGVAPFFLVHVLPHLRKWLSPAPPRTHPIRTPGKKFNLNVLAEACGQGLTILIVLWMVFAQKENHYHPFYLCFIPIIWIAMRQGIERVVTGLLLMNFGIIAAMHAYPPSPDLYTNVALLMLVLSAVGLIVGSEVSERHRLAIHLNEQTVYLDALIQNSPLGIAVLDRQGAVDLANPAYQELVGGDQSELVSVDNGMTGTRDARVASYGHMIRQIFAGKAVRRSIRRLRKNGVVVDLAVHGVPLLLNNTVRGAYLMYEDISDQVRASEAQRQHAESLDRLVRDSEIRTRQMMALNEMGRLLECSGNVNEACSVVATSIEKLFPEAQSGALYLFKASRNLIAALARWGESGLSETTFSAEACWSLRRGVPHWTERPGRGISCAHLAESSTTECLCVPMVAQGNTVGMLHLEFENDASRSDASKESSAREGKRRSRQELAVSAGAQIALSLANLQLRETLREQSIRDPLTHLYNRRFLEHSLERELQIASRKTTSVAILFLDVDHFKRFNDAFGHEAGDIALMALADLFRNFFRATDICCRYGGEEFAIVMPESSSQDAALRAESLRAEVKSLNLRHKRETFGQISISIGVAAFPQHGCNAQELLKIADQCLYQSKARGRDAVTVASTQAV